MFFVILEMPSKTFVMVLKKLLDHFKSYRSLYWMKESWLLLSGAVEDAEGEGGGGEEGRQRH